MKSQRDKRPHARRLPTGWPDMLPIPPLPETPAKQRPGSDIGYIEICRDGYTVRIDFLEPGILHNGRRARSDTIATASGEVMSIRAAALMAVSALPGRMTLRQQQQADALWRGS